MATVSPRRPPYWGQFGPTKVTPREAPCVERMRSLGGEAGGSTADLALSLLSRSPMRLVSLLSEAEVC